MQFFFVRRNGVTSRHYARQNRIFEIFFKHPCVIYRWKAEDKSSILVKKIIEIDNFLTELLTFKVYDVIASPPGGGTRSEYDGYVRPEMGGRKNDPYSDRKMTKEKTPLQ